MSARLQAVLAANEDFAKAFVSGEKWAIRRAEQIRGLDGLASSAHPEREFDDTPKNYCGSCPFRDGCMVCDLDYDPRMDDLVGRIADYQVRCDGCEFLQETSAIDEDEVINHARDSHHALSRSCRGKITATISSRHPLVKR